MNSNENEKEKNINKQGKERGFGIDNELQKR
jgi:hypothetical protein